ncbi:MAG: hypothetical protein ACR2PF_16060 [Rhizobiaceae bacterium]
MSSNLIARSKITINSMVNDLLSYIVSLEAVDRQSFEQRSKAGADQPRLRIGMTTGGIDRA